MGFFKGISKKIFGDSEAKSIPRGAQFPTWLTMFNSIYNKPSYQQGAFESHKRLIKSNWTTACIQAYCRAVMSVRFVAEKWDDKEKDWIRVANHPIEKVIDHPVHYQPSDEFFRMIITNLLKDGNAVISIKHSKVLKQTQKLEVLNLDGVIPVADNVDLIKGYKVGIPGETEHQYKFLSPKEIIHVKLVNTDNPLWGISPLEAAKDIQDAESFAMTWNKRLMENSGRPPFCLTTKDTLTTTQRKEIRAALIEDMSGDNLGLPLILMNGLAPVKLGETPVDLDYIQSVYLDCERICSLLGVPPVVIEISKNATLANAREFMRSFYSQSVIPLLRIICGAFNHYWVHQYYGENYRLWFDTSDIPELKEDFQLKVGFVPVLFDKGYTMNELNRALHLGLPEIPTGNIRQVSGHIVDRGGYEFDLPVAAGGDGHNKPSNGSQIGQGQNKPGGGDGLVPNPEGDSESAKPDDPVARKKPFGRKDEKKP